MPWRIHSLYMPVLHQTIQIEYLIYMLHYMCIIVYYIQRFAGPCHPNTERFPSWIYETVFQLHKWILNSCPHSESGWKSEYLLYVNSIIWYLNLHHIICMIWYIYNSSRATGIDRRNPISYSPIFMSIQSAEQPCYNTHYVWLYPQYSYTTPWYNLIQ